jgi:hypothetical protein
MCKNCELDIFELHRAGTIPQSLFDIILSGSTSNSITPKKKYDYFSCIEIRQKLVDNIPRYLYPSFEEAKVL